MTGTLRERPFAEIVGAVFQAKQTGELTVSTAGKVITIHFQDGNPVAAASDDPTHRIARILLDNDKIGLGEAEMLGGLPESKQAFETVEYIPPDTLLWGVKFRFLRLLEELFSWQEGEYEFVEGPVPPEALTLKVPTPFVIFTGTAKMPSSAFGAVADEKVIDEVRELPAELESFFNPQRKKFLAACSPGQSVGDLLSSMSGDRERSRHTLYALTALGLVSVGEAPATVPETSESKALFDDEEEAAPAMEPEAPSLDQPKPDPDLEPPPPEEPEPAELEPEIPLTLDAEAESETAPPSLEEPEEEGPMSLDAAEGPVLEAEHQGLAADTPLSLETEEAPPLDPAPELPLEMPEPEEDAAGTIPEEAQEAATQEEDLSFAEDVGEGASLSQTLGLNVDQKEEPAFEEPEKVMEPRKGRRLVPSTRAGKIALLGGVLFLLTSGLLLGMNILQKEPVPPPPEPPAVPSRPFPSTPAASPEAEDAEKKAEKPVDTGEAPAGGTVASGAAPEDAPVDGTERTEMVQDEEPADALLPPEETAEGIAPVATPPGKKPAGEEVERGLPEAFGDDTPETALNTGDVERAARMWADRLSQEPRGTYTLQVLMACEVKSILESYHRFQEAGEVYTVPFNLQGRACYRVGIGTYDTILAAKTALRGLPHDIRAEGAVIKSFAQFLPGEQPPGGREPVVGTQPPPVEEKETAQGVNPAEILPAHGKALEVLRTGDLDAAAGMWREMLDKAPAGTYTLQVLTACDPGTVSTYFSLFEEHGRVFAVPFRLRGTACYRLGLETYRSKEEAQAALEAMPQWVRDQRTVVKNLNLFVK